MYVMLKLILTLIISDYEGYYHRCLVTVYDLILMSFKETQRRGIILG